MSSSQGWISLSRKVRDCWIWQDKPFSKGQAWVDMLLSANHEDKKFLLGNELVEVKRGSFITSEHKLMDKWGWSKTKVRAFLLLLENDSMIVKISDKKKTTINIVNYSDYQDSQTTKEPQKNHEETTKEPQKDPNNNDNNENNVNKNNKDNVQSDDFMKSVTKKDIDQFFEDVWKLYPNKKGKGQVSDSKKKTLYGVGIEQLTKAIERYKDELKKDEEWRKPQNGSTFFNSGYVDYLDNNYTPSTEQQKPSTGKVNKFNNFPQRDYTADQMLSMEQRLLNR